MRERNWNYGTIKLPDKSHPWKRIVVTLAPRSDRSALLYLQCFKKSFDKFHFCVSVCVLLLAMTMALSWQIECADIMNEEAQLCKTRLTQRSVEGVGGAHRRLIFCCDSNWICHWQSYGNFILGMHAEIMFVHCPNKLRLVPKSCLQFFRQK
jgi:hypothetical protein